MKMYLTLFLKSEINGLYYKPMTIINEDSRVIHKLEASLIDDARDVIYDCHMFIIQSTDFPLRPGNTKVGSITVSLTSCLTGLESAV